MPTHLIIMTITYRWWYSAILQSYSLDCSSSLISESPSLSVGVLMSSYGFNLHQMFQTCTITSSDGRFSRGGQNINLSTIGFHLRSSRRCHNQQDERSAVLLLSSLSFRLFSLPLASSILTVQERFCSQLILETVTLFNPSL